MKRFSTACMHAGFSLACLSIFELSASEAHSTDIIYPHYSLSSTEVYDASQIKAYTGEHKRIYGHIDEHLTEHFGNLQRWVRQPSISAQNVGITQMAELLGDDLAAIGFKETHLVPTSGHPGVWGYYDAGAATTLMVYMMYDVQPVNPQDWESPPFEGNLVEREFGQVMMARGATNQKGPERAFLNAVDSIIKVTGTLPVNLMILAEGEEELGSPHYPELVDAFEARLKTADGVLFPFNSQGLDGSLSVLLGVKGILYWELSSSGGDWGGPTRSEIHGSFKAVVDSPTQRLIAAIASMTSDDGNTILIDGYYDDVRSPTAEESTLINAMAKDWCGTSTM